ncbi:MAG: hypothetical protein FJZ09_04010 [Candidatus Omnitrophica bacterium]|nr:hypothetical protein [Candidatus Omnitrophota bacterium]
MQENRGYQRFTLEGEVRLKQVDGATSSFKAFLDNMSFSGFAMYSTEELKVGSLVEFELVTPLLDEYLPGRGKVRHMTLPNKYTAKIFTFGVEFTEVNQDKVTYILKRQEQRLAKDKIKNKPQSNPLDFIPY